jgi:hypothetical protein
MPRHYHPQQHTPDAAHQVYLSKWFVYTYS